MADLLVIFGAGASFGAPLSEDQSGPPLTKYLFADEHDALIQRFPGVDSLRSVITSRVDLGVDLEKVLAELQEQTNPNIRERVQEVPPYLRALIAQTSDTQRPTVYDDLLHRIQERNLTVAFVTLNYDTLLESAIRRQYRHTIEGLNEYARDENCSSCTDPLTGRTRRTSTCQNGK